MNYFSQNWLIHKLEDDAICRAIQKYARGDMLDIGCGEKVYEKFADIFISKHVGLDHEGTLHDTSKVDIVATAYDIPCETHSFDTILCTFVMEHLEDPESALREAHRVLSKDGYAIYAVPLFWHIHEEPRDFYRFTKYGLKYLFEKCNFQIVELIPLSGFWVTFGQGFVYYIWRFRGGGFNPLRYVIPIVGALIQMISLMLDRISHSEEFCCEYVVVARKMK